MQSRAPFIGGNINFCCSFCKASRSVVGRDVKDTLFGGTVVKKSILKNYAQLIVKMGVNIQPGQEVFISAELDQPEFVEMLVEAAYRAGASRVVVDWSHQRLTLHHVKYQSPEVLGDLTSFQEARWKYYADHLPCRIYLLSEDPDGLKNINQKKMAEAQAKRFPRIKPYRDKMENQYQWCIAAVPGKAWAKKLFPELRVNRAVETLWEAILMTARADGPDPIAAWQVHNDDIHQRCSYLNQLGICELHYYGDNGTDLRVGMIPQARFCGGSEKSLKNIEFNPNIPSEECFISPMRGKAEGIVYATKPLSYQGQLIEDFWIRFENGRAVEWSADKNEALLGKLIGMDDGSAYLGECALVPHNSPISELGLLFLNTLFDENAACHLALGMGFADTIEGFENLSLEECRALGVNDSMVHEDFMIGYEGLNIDAETITGDIVPIFKNGCWAF